MIDLVPNDEQLQIMRVAAEAALPLSGKSASDLSGASWQRLGQMGVFSLGVPESVGGAGCGRAEEVLVAEAFGRNLAPVSLIGSILAGSIMSAAGVVGVDSVLRGAIRVSFAVESEQSPRLRILDFEGSQLVAVLHGYDLSIVKAEDITGLRESTSLDKGTSLHEAEGVQDVIIRSIDTSIASRSRLLLAAMAAGLAGSCLERAVAHARTRHQYGRPIGTYQAVKHRCVDMAVRHEAAVASVRLAALRADREPAVGLSEAAALVASRAARANAADAVQIHGGIGFTAQGGLDRLVHRSWLLEQLVGPSPMLAEQLVSGVQNGTF